jgi:glycosyltransferase involved in cell wall biosynthesis
VKIACIIHSLDGGGAERVMARLASQLAQRGHAVTLITLDDAAGDRHDVDPRVARLPLAVMSDSRGLVQKWLHVRRRVRAVRRAITASDPEVVLSFCDRTNILALMSVGKRVPVVIAERSDPRQQSLGAVWEALRRQTYPKAARIIALTDTAAQNLQPLSPQPVAVIASAVDPPPCFSDRGVASANRLILGVGRLEPEKGFDRLLEAFAEATATRTDWTLRILGEGSQRQSLQQLADRLEVAPRVTMPGWIRPVWDELSRATLFVLPSRYEGLPSALLEAMAAGVPSVAADCESGPRAIIDHETDGLLVANDVSGLAAGITRMIADPSLRESLGHQGKNVVDRFPWHSLVEQYEQVLRECCRD